MKASAIVIVVLLGLTACHSKQQATDGAIRRVDDCVCYRSTEGQQLKPWQLNWDDAEKLREQFSHCVCKAHIDLKTVPNPKKYVVPGTKIE